VAVPRRSVPTTRRHRRDCHQPPGAILLEPVRNDTTATVEPRGIEVLGMRRSLDALPSGGLAGALAPVGWIGSGLSRPLPALPAGLRYRSLTVADNGLRLTVGGDDVTAGPAAAGGRSCGSRSTASYSRRRPGPDPTRDRRPTAG
jgi:hypothetical protein